MNDTTNRAASSDAEPKTTSARPDRSSRERWQLKNWLWGYDFFISYHWVSGGTYAVNLAARLREKGYEVFLDRAEYAMGDKWKDIGEVALRNTRRLVLIATREAVFESKPVEHEVIKFTDRGRHCIPIFFGDTFTAEEQTSPGKFVVLDRLPDDTLYIEDAIENLLIGPATEVVEKLAAAHGIMRRRKLRQTITLIGVSLLVVFSVFASISWYNTWTAKEAEAEAKEVAEQRVAEMSLQMGHLAINSHGDVGAGLLWYAQTLQTTGTRAASARQSARSLIGGWSPSLPRRSIVHDEAVVAVAFNSDGRTVATASENGAARLWDANTGRPRGQPMRHDDIVNAVSFSPDGKTVATASSDGTARLWDTNSGQLQGMPLTHDDQVRGVWFSPHGNLIAAMQRPNVENNRTQGANAVRLWDVATHQLVLEIPQERPIHDVRFSPDGTFLAVAVQFESTQIWKVADGELHREIPTGDGIVYKARFSPDGELIATAGSDMTQLWEVDTGEPRGNPLEHDGEVYALCFSPQGDLVATGCADGYARMWNVATGLLHGKPLEQNDMVYIVCFSPDGSTLATLTISLMGAPVLVRLWDVTTAEPKGDPLHSDATILDMCFSPNGDTLATAGKDGIMRLWNIVPQETRGEPLTHMDSVFSMSFSPDGRNLATLTSSVVRLWDVPSRDERALPQSGNVNALCFSPHGNLLAGSYESDDGDAGGVQLWDVATGKTYLEPFKHERPVWAIRFSPDGRLLASGSYDGTARLWDVAMGKEHGKSLRHNSRVLDVSFSSDGKTLVTASADNNARLWDVATGRLQEKPFDHGDTVLGAWLTPDRKTLITAGGDSRVRLWDIATGMQRGRLINHDYEGPAVCFTPEIGLLASVGQIETSAGPTTDRNVWLWNIVTGQPHSDPLRHDAPIQAMCFNSDGSMFATISEGVARVWDVSSGQIRSRPFLCGSSSQMSFHPNGRMLAIQSGGTVRFWDVNPPAPNEGDQVWSLETRTGKTIENGLVRRLTKGEWLLRMRDVTPLPENAKP